MADLFARVGSRGRSTIMGGALSSYSTSFPTTENPISESGNWGANGLTNGLDWNDVRVTSGLAFGTQNSSPNFSDSVASLAGTWGNDQTLIATVKTINQLTGTSVFEEVELLARYTIGAHSVTGYEFTYACRASGDANRYFQMNRWNGTFGSFTTLDSRAGPGLANGDKIKATITGNPWPVLTIYSAPAADPTNFTAVFSYNTFTGGDGTLNGQPDTLVFASGHPGIGMYNQGGTSSINTDFGLTSLSVTAS